ncbi:MAG: LytTR family DNA-binding domain-containing protein [Chitinophagaceae bacterium]
MKNTAVRIIIKQEKKYILSLPVLVLKVSDIQLLQSGVPDNMLPHPHDSFISVLCHGYRIRIPFDDIIYVSRVADATIINTHTENYKTVHRVKEILEALPADKFFRIHRSHIIATAYLKDIRNDQIIINGHCLTISYYFKHQLLERLQSK